MEMKKIKIYRIFNLFRRDFRITCLALGGIFLLLPLIVMLAEGGINPVLLLVLLGFNLTWFFTLLFNYPGRAEICDGVLSYSEYYEISKGTRRRVRFAVTNVREVEYLQNRLERKLNIGRVRFRCDAELETKFHSEPSRTMVLQLCGVSDFAAFSEQFESVMNPCGADCEHVAK